MSDQVLIVTDGEEACRLDKFLSFHFETSSRSYFQYLIEQDAVLVNGKSAKKSTKLKIGDEIEVQFILTAELDLTPENIPLDVLYEDDELLAINKPAGLVVHPAPGHRQGTFVNALLYYCKTIEKHDSLRPGIVHRLDKDTTGVLVAAKTAAMHQALSLLFAERRVEKRYLGVCFGKPKATLIDSPLGRHPTMRKMMTVTCEGKPARTHLEVRSTRGDLSYLEILLETGRTHQIRAHLKAIGHPLLGDPVYGAERKNRQYDCFRQMLHAATLSFIHPKTGKLLVINAPMPKDMQNIIEKIV